MDDESYFTLDGSDCAGNRNYFYKQDRQINSEIKFKRHSKFSKKILVWIAISAKGRSTAYIVPSGLAVNQNIYMYDEPR